MNIHLHICIHICVCVCVLQRERDLQHGRDGGGERLAGLGKQPPVLAVAQLLEQFRCSVQPIYP